MVELSALGQKNFPQRTVWVIRFRILFPALSISGGICGIVSFRLQLQLCWLVAILKSTFGDRAGGICVVGDSTRMTIAS